MNINLLPQDMRPARKQRGWQERLAMLALILLLVGVGAAYWLMEHRLANQLSTIAKMNATANQLADIRLRVEGLDQAKKQLAKLQKERAFIAPSMVTHQLLIELGQLMPQDVVLTEVGYDSAGVVTIRGQGATLSSAGRLLSQLSKSQYLEGQKLNTITAITGAYVFDITARVREEGR